MKTTVSLAVAGNSAWIRQNSLQRPFLLGLYATITNGASLTYKVQFTGDCIFDTSRRRSISISRTTTVATVTDTDHRLSVGDSVFIENSGDANLDGTYDVASVTNANVYTYTVANTGAAASNGGCTGTYARVFDHATMVAKTGKAFDTIAVPCECVRLVTTVYASGKVDLTVISPSSV